jgi:hypothetical protein
LTNVAVTCGGTEEVEEGGFERDSVGWAASVEELIEEDDGLEGADPEEGEIVTSSSCFKLQLVREVTGEDFVVEPPNSTAGPGFGNTGSSPSIVRQVPSPKTLAA